MSLTVSFIVVRPVAVSAQFIFWGVMSLTEAAVTELDPRHPPIHGCLGPIAPRDRPPQWSWDHEVFVAGLGVQVYKRTRIQIRVAEDTLLVLGRNSAPVRLTYTRSVNEYWGGIVGRWSREGPWQVAKVGWGFGGRDPLELW